MYSISDLFDIFDSGLCSGVVVGVGVGGVVGVGVGVVSRDTPIVCLCVGPCVVGVVSGGVVGPCVVPRDTPIVGPPVVPRDTPIVCLCV
ncbi:hypothetical protein CWI38_0685p0010, partial [Hamiltosporidium tvaerminnensis]